MTAREQAAALYGRLCAHLEDLEAGRIDRVLYAVRAEGIYHAAREQGAEVQAAFAKLLEGDDPGRPRSLIG